jgi:hypothetical protein
MDRQANTGKHFHEIHFLVGKQLQLQAELACLNISFDAPYLSRYKKNNKLNGCTT